MDIEIEWADPIQLRKTRRSPGIYTMALDEVEPAAGVYIFARKWGQSYEALYVGRSENLRRRMKSHLDRLKLMQHLEQARTGKRVVLLGYAIPKRGQKLDRILKLAERSLIRHFLSEGHDLVNEAGTRLRQHQIHAVGSSIKGFVPSTMLLDREKRRR